MITMLRALMEKIDNIQEQIYNVKRQMETLRKNTKGDAGSQKGSKECLW